MSDHSEQYYFEQLNPRVKEIIEETGTKLAVEDLEALSNVSVRALALLFEDIAKGINKEKALHEMRIRAVEQLREKKLLKQELQDHWEIRSVWLKEQKEVLKNQRLFVKQDTRQTLKDLARQLEQSSRQYQDVRSHTLQEALEAERMQLERCFEFADILSEVMDECEDCLSALKDEEERLLEAEERSEAASCQKAVDLAEAAYLECMSNISQYQFELEQAQDSLRELRLKREAIAQNPDMYSDDEDEDAPPPEDDDEDDAPPPEDDDDDIPPPDDDDLAPPPEDEEEENPKDDEGISQNVGLESMAAIMAAMKEESSDDENENDSAVKEIDEAEEVEDAEVAASQEISSPGDEFESNRYENEFESDDAKRVDSKRGGKRSVPQQRMDVNDLPTTEWLKCRFDVVKTDPKKKFLSKKYRTWDLDFFSSLFSNMTRRGKVMKSMQPRQLVLLERSLKDTKVIRMQFFEASHAYDLLFTSNYNRERFYEAASALRPTQYVWCPNLCVKGESKSKTELFGSFGFTEKGVVKAVKGACKLNVTSQPHETIQVFCGTWNMGEKKLPSDPAELREWIIPDKYDLYTICIQESNISKDKFLGYIQSVLGPDYIGLASFSYSKTQMFVFAKKNHGMKIGNVEADARPGSVSGRGTIAISLSFNSTHISFLGSHFAEDTISENLVGVRNKMYRDSSYGMKLGNKSLDPISQSQYVFWMGDFGYNVELPYSVGVEHAQKGEFNELQSHDQLQKEMANKEIFVGFREGSIQFRPTYRYHKGTDNFNQVKKTTPSYPDRVFYRAWPGCAIANTEYKSPNLSVSSHKPVFATFKINTLRPFSSIFMPLSPSCEIKFDEIRLIGNSKKIMKPSLTLYNHSMETVNGEKIVGKVESPVWNNLPAIVPSTPHREFLLTQHITIVIRDLASKNSDGGNNIVASGVLHLKPLVQSSPAVILFKVPAFSHGMEAGEIEGFVKLVYADDIQTSQ